MVTITEASPNLTCFETGSITIEVSYRTNTWIGPSVGNWNDAAGNWSLGSIPTDCDEVIIPLGKSVTILSGQTGSAYTLLVEDGGDLEVVDTGSLHVVAPE